MDDTLCVWHTHSACDLMVTMQRCHTFITLGCDTKPLSLLQRAPSLHNSWNIVAHYRDSLWDTMMLQPVQRQSLAIYFWRFVLYPLYHRSSCTLHQHRPTRWQGHGLWWQLWCAAKRKLRNMSNYLRRHDRVESNCIGCATVTGQPSWKAENYSLITKPVLPTSATS